MEKCPAITYTDRTVVVDDEFYHSSTRYRTNTYTFDLNIYANWRGSTGVWLGDSPATLNKETPDDPKPFDEGEHSSQNTSSNYVQKCTSKDPTFAALQQSSSSPSTVVEGITKAATSPDLENKPDNTHLDLSNSISFNKLGNTQPPARTHTSVSDPAIVEGQDRKIADNPPNDELAAENPQSILQHMLKDNSPMLKDNTSPAGASIADRHRILAIDYKRLDDMRRASTPSRS